MLVIHPDRPDSADGAYTVQAAGYTRAVLYWANADGPLPDCTAFACLALGQTGAGCFEYTGGRAVPPDATHAAALLTAPDRPDRLVLSPLPVLPAPAGPPFMTIGVMSDLHLSSKPYRIRKAMRLLREADCVLIPGDLTNDGLPQQLEAFCRLIDEELPGIPVLAVAGNHDFPARPLPLIPDGTDHYYALQEWLLRRASELGVSCLQDASGAYHARMKGCSFFGLNAVSHFRRFVFHDGAQPDWLEAQLARCPDAYRFILCHAPLQRHQNNRTLQSAPYLNRDSRLQSIVDRAGSLFFLSGHTHLSLNDPEGGVERDALRDIVYLNDSSVTRTALPGSEEPPSEWTDGAVVLIGLCDGETIVSARSVSSGRRISRGFYRFPAPQQPGNIL